MSLYGNHEVEFLVGGKLSYRKSAYSSDVWPDFQAAPLFWKSRNKIRGDLGLSIRSDCWCDLFQEPRVLTLMRDFSIQNFGRNKDPAPQFTDVIRVASA